MKVIIYFTIIKNIYKISKFVVIEYENLRQIEWEEEVKMKKILIVLIFSTLLFGCNNQSNSNNTTGDNVDTETNKENISNDNVDIIQIEATDHTPPTEIHFIEDDTYDAVPWTGVNDAATFEIKRNGDFVVQVDIERADRNEENEEKAINNQFLEKQYETENNGIKYYVYKSHETENTPNGSVTCYAHVLDEDLWLTLHTHYEYKDSSFSTYDSMLNDIEESINRIEKIVVY